jgi:GTP:adenosylcobinamide-phosphate guanylyltransferase
MSMHAIIPAGGIPQPKDSLYAYTQGKFKVLLLIEGKPIIQWVVDALNESGEVDRIIIVGLPDDTPIQSKRQITFVASQNDLMLNIQAAAEKVVELDPTCTDAFLVSGDIPGLTAEMVKWLAGKVKQRPPMDIHYTVVAKQAIESEFPGSKRTYTKMKDCEVSGGDCSVFNPHMAIDPNARWRKLIDYRKSPIKQAALIGFDTLFLLLIGQLSLKEAERRVTRRLDICGEVVLAPYAGIAMDVDKAHQLEIMRRYLHNRKSK